MALKPYEPRFYARAYIAVVCRLLGWHPEAKEALPRVWTRFFCCGI